MKKNILLYSLFLISLVAFLPGCEKEKDKEEPIAGSKPSIEVTISPETVNQGGSSTLIYKISDATTMSINGEPITKMIDTLILTNLQTDKVFNFEAENDYGTTTINKKITVIPLQPNLPSLRTLTADPPILPIGGGITIISWTSNENTTSVEFDGISYPANGSLPVNVINDSTTLVFVAKGPEGQRASSILIEVEEEIIVPPPTVKEMLCQFSRILSGIRYYLIENPDVWIYPGIDECRADNTSKYEMDNTCILDRNSLCPGETDRFLYSTYTLVGMLLDNSETITSIDEYGNLTSRYQSVIILGDGVSTKPIIVEETRVPVL